MRTLKVTLLVVFGLFTLGCGICTVNVTDNFFDIFNPIVLICGVLPALLFGAICWWLIRSLRKPKP